MMIAWQDIIAVALSLIAAGFVAWRACRAFTKRSDAGCGSGCGSCPQSSSQPKLINIAPK